MTARRRQLLSLFAVVLAILGTLSVGRAAGAVPRGVTTAAAAPSEPGTYIAVAPSRVLDSRSGLGAPKAALAPGASVAVMVAGVHGVPTEVSAVVVNLTATAPSAAGYLTAFADGSTKPTVSSLNFVAGATVANLAVIPVGADGRIKVANGSTGRVQVIVDISGYYASGAPRAAGTFGSITPVRILDTRSGIGAAQKAVAPNASIAVTIAGVDGVPAGVSAVVVNLTATATSAAGYLTAFAHGDTRPSTSSLNFVSGQTVANLAVVPVGADGKIELTNGSAGRVQVLVDISGYYLGGAASVPGALGSLAPIRILDTRTGTGAARATIRAGASVAIRVAGNDGIPSGVSAVVVNLTVAAPTADGYLTAAADGATTPSTSNLNFVRGRTVANLAMVPVGADGSIRLANGSRGTVQVIADISGSYRMAQSSPRGGPLSWGPVTALDPDQGHPEVLSCTGTTFCMAGDAYGKTMLFDGRSWGTPQSVDPTRRKSPFEALSCTSPTFCMALFGVVIRTWNGATWSVPQTDPPSAGLLSCVTPTFCMVIGAQEAVSTWDGYSWTARGAIDTSNGSLFESGLNALTCKSSTFCVAVDDYGTLYRFDGAQWTAASSGVKDTLVSVSCSSSRFCAAVGLAGDVSIWDGRTWTGQDAIPAADGRPLPVVSCWADGNCRAMRGDGYIVSYGGGRWVASTTAVDPQGTYYATVSLSCPLATRCVLIDSRGIGSAMLGTAWSAPTIIEPTGGSPTTASCGSATSCVVGDGAGSVLTYDGTSWSQPHLLSPLREPISAVSCAPDSDQCVALDVGGAAYTWDGRSWSPGVRINGDQPLYSQALSCTGGGFCLAVGARGWSELLDGTWSPVRAWSAPSSNPYDTDISCVGPSFCIGMNDTEVATFDGHDWSDPTTIEPPTTTPPGTILFDLTLQSVACASASFCLVTNAVGYVATYDGHVWTAERPTDIIGRSFGAASCPQVNDCVVAGDVEPAPSGSGQPPAATADFDGSAWSGPDLTGKPDDGYFSQLSCPSYHFCVGLDNGRGVQFGRR